MIEYERLALNFDAVGFMTDLVFSVYLLLLY